MTKAKRLLFSGIILFSLIGFSAWQINNGGGSGGAPTTRNIATTAPLAGGGDLSADRTLTCTTCATTTNGGALAGTANQITLSAGGTLALASPLTTPGAATITGTLAETGAITLNGTSSGSATIDPGTTAASLTIAVPARAANGSNGAPAYSFTSCTGCGMYTDGASNVGISSTNVAFGTNGANLRVINGLPINWGSSLSAAADTGLSRVAVGVMAVGSGAQASQAGLVLSGNKVFVAGDFTSAANTSLQTITGLSWTLPATALNYSFDCDIIYSQATANAAVAFGIQAATNAPTAINAMGQEGTSLTAFTTGTLRALASTTATNIVSATPSAFGALGTAADMFNVHLAGTIENPAVANTINIMISTANSSDLTTVYRGSKCYLH